MTSPGQEALDWLKTLAADISHVDVLMGLWSAEFAGVRYVGATAGHAMTLLRGDDPAPAFDRAGESLALLTGAEWLPLDWPAFEAWALRQNGRCAACGGLGFVYTRLSAFDEDGNGPIDDLWERCACSNGGASRIGTAYGVTLDRFLLLRYMGPLKATAVQVTHVGETMLALRAPDWMILVMWILSENGGEAFPAQKAAP